MIASRISGYVTEVPPPTHTHVHPGDVLAVFETEPLAAVVDERRASVEVAEAAMSAALAEVEAANAAGAAVAGHRVTTEARKVAKQVEVRSAEARAASLEAERDHAAMDAERAETLYDARSISRSGLDDARTRLVRAEHDLQAAIADAAKLRSELLVLDAEIAELDAEATEREANLSRANARHQSAAAALESAKAKLEAAELDLASTEVRAPIEGFIANQTVEPGFYIEEGWPMMAVVPLHSIWVTANFKETQLERLRVGQGSANRGRCVPGPSDHRPHPEFRAGERRVVLSVAAAKRIWQLREGRAASACQDPVPDAGSPHQPDRARHVGRGRG